MASLAHRSALEFIARTPSECFTRFSLRSVTSDPRFSKFSLRFYATQVTDTKPLASSSASKNQRDISNKLALYSKYNPTPMQLQEFIRFGRTSNERTSFRFLKSELPVRLANMIAEFSMLSEPFLQMPSINVVKNWYETSFGDVLEFESARTTATAPDAPDDATLQRFTRALARIYDRHKFVVETLAQGVLEFKERTDGHLDPVFDAQLQYFLDRFYMSRISIRMLINQHVLLFGRETAQTKRPDRHEMRLVGSIDSQCDVLAVVREAYDTARYLAERYYTQVPRTAFPELALNARSVENGVATDALPNIRITYVPSHLYYIFFEIFKNSLRAEIEMHYGDPADTKVEARKEKAPKALPPLQVQICKGKHDVSIRMSDEGGGFSLATLDNAFRYSFTTARKPRTSLTDAQSGPDPHQSAGDPPLAGYGYGLPLSRLYARYFGGDLVLAPREGYGVDSYLYLKRDPSQAGEHLPVFNTTSAKIYDAAGLPVNDWMSVPQSPAGPAASNAQAKGPGARKGGAAPLTGPLSTTRRSHHLARLVTSGNASR